MFNDFHVIQTYQKKKLKSAISICKPKLRAEQFIMMQK